MCSHRYHRPVVGGCITAGRTCGGEGGYTVRRRPVWLRTERHGATSCRRRRCYDRVRGENVTYARANPPPQYCILLQRRRRRPLRRNRTAAVCIRGARVLLHCRIKIFSVVCCAAIASPTYHTSIYIQSVYRPYNCVGLCV